MDFYATAAAVAGKPLPERCDGKNLLPYLTDENSADVHEYLFWNNDDPTDNKHRNLYVVRWKNWRLVKYPEGWKLFDLANDPQETIDVAKNHPEIMENLKKRHDAFVATLPPLKPSANYKRPNNQPRGWGWIIGNGTG